MHLLVQMGVKFNLYQTVACYAVLPHCHIQAIKVLLSRDMRNRDFDLKLKNSRKLQILSNSAVVGYENHTYILGTLNLIQGVR